MKQKLLTLFALFVVAVTGAWADSEWIMADWSTGHAGLTYWANGSSADIGSTSTDSSTPSWSDNSTYKTYFGTGGSSNFQLDSKTSTWKSNHPNRVWSFDVVAGQKINVYFMGGGSGDRSMYLSYNASTTNRDTETAFGSATANGYTPTILTATATNDGTVYLWADNNVRVYAIKVTTIKNVTSRVLTGININGNAWNIAGLSGNAATINDEYAGPPTVQFVYTENYDDDSSTAGKTEEVVAVKNGANYEATSTVLTTNVTLSFTNVSNVLFSMTNPTAPTEALASKASSAVTATFSPGGSAVVYNGHGSNTAVMVDGNGINLAGSGNSYFKASFPSPMAEGDVIDCSNHDGTFYVWHSDSKTNSQTLPYTIPANSELIGKKVVYVKKDGASTFSTFTVTRAKTIESQEFGGVKKGETTLTETTDYTVSETTITLTDAHKATLVPTDVKLINHITYSDDSTEDEDVTVNFDGTITSGYYIGTASIGETNYTVKVKQSTSPWMALTQESITLKSTPVQRAATANVTLTGGFLTDGTYDVATTADGLSISPTTFTVASGEVDQAFTITYNKDIVTSGSEDVTFFDGTTSKVLTINYSSVVPHTVSTVSEATTWDWSVLSVTGDEFKLTASTTPTKEGSTNIVAADFDGDVYAMNVGFPTKYDALVFNLFEFPARKSGNGTGNKFFQGTQISFTTNKPGTIDVTFANTGNREKEEDNRYLNVNGVNTEYKALTATPVDATNIPVPAGKVVIKGKLQKDNSDQYLRISKIVFTPLSGENKDVVNVTDVDYATYVTTDDIDFTKTDGVQAYKVTSAADAIEYEEVEAAPEGTPLLIKANSSSYVLKAADATPAAVTGNLLQASTGSTVGDGSTIYVLGKKEGNAVWGLLKNGNTLSAGKAYLVITGGGAKEFYDIIIGGDGETTNISNLNANANLNTTGQMYNLAGQKVTESYKGIVIVNGKKYMNK
jgi:hypothetical protein